jgi:hypothetical protein
MKRPYDLIERSYEYSKAIVLFIKRSDFKRSYYPVIDQLLRSAIELLLEESDELARILAKSILTLKNNDAKVKG